MQILKYESDQYAGVRNQNVTFTGGMNVVLGENEIGKSTMITGIYETLLRPYKIKLSSTAGTAFREQGFPTGGGNRIDGKVRLAFGDEECIIKKEWEIKKEKGKEKIDSDVIFIDSSDRKYTGTEAEERIDQLLNYGEAIYNHIVFGRQNNEAAILDWFYSFVDTEGTQEKGIAEARKRVSEALSAAGGISEDLYLQKLKERIEALGSHWDFSLDAPEKGKGINNPWKKECGEVLKAYYELEEQKQAFNKDKELMDSVREDEDNLQDKKKQKSELESQIEKLNREKSAVETKDFQSGRKCECEKNLRRFGNVRQEWPGLESDKEKIEKLSAEEEEQEKRIRKKELEETVGELHALEEQRKAVLMDIDGMEKIEEENRACCQLLDEIERIQLKLGSAKLHAQVNMLSDDTARLVTADGETIQIEKEYDGSINGFAKIQIPGIAEILVAPQELDVAGSQGQIEKNQAEIQEILVKYKATDREELNQKCETYRNKKSDLADLDQKIREVRNGKNAKDLEEELQNIRINEAISIRENLTDEVRNVLLKYDAKTLDSCKTAVRTKIEAYENDYGSVVKLEETMAEEERKLTEAKEALKGLESVSWTKEEFESAMDEIQVKLKGRDRKSGLNREIEELIAKIARKNQNIEDIDLYAKEQEAKELERILKQKKKLYCQYSRIKADFESMKEKQGNKSDAFYGQFNKYLSIITRDKVRIANGKIRSDKNELNSKELLSRGTKQTLLLAFRLALLEYYYQNDGGIMILDDVLLDMDPERRKQSVELLQKFAEKNQVIFTTCDPLIADMLGGHRIELESSRVK